MPYIGWTKPRICLSTLVLAFVLVRWCWCRCWRCFWCWCWCRCWCRCGVSVWCVAVAAAVVTVAVDVESVIGSLALRPREKRGENSPSHSTTPTGHRSTVYPRVSRVPARRDPPGGSFDTLSRLLREAFPLGNFPIALYVSTRYCCSSPLASPGSFRPSPLPRTEGMSKKNRHRKS